MFGYLQRLAFYLPDFRPTTPCKSFHKVLPEKLVKNTAYDISFTNVCLILKLVGRRILTQIESSVSQVTLSSLFALNHNVIISFRN